jgi:hypothetical protein
MLDLAVHLIYPRILGSQHMTVKADLCGQTAVAQGYPARTCPATGSRTKLDPLKSMITKSFGRPDGHELS